MIDKNKFGFQVAFFVTFIGAALAAFPYVFIVVMCEWAGIEISGIWLEMTCAALCGGYAHHMAIRL